MSKSKQLDALLGIKRFNYKECLGIYISLKDVYVAQILEKSGGIEVDSLIKLPVEGVDPSALRPADLNEGFFSKSKYWLDPIKKIIDSKKWNTKNIVISLAPNFSILRHFVMQDVARHYWKQAVPLQARKYIHYPFERAASDYYVYPFYANLSKSNRLGVVFSLTSERIISMLEAGIKNIGLNLVAVETSPLSIYRLFKQTDKENMPGKGCIYANFTNHEGQFLYAVNDVPVLMREVEVTRANGTRKGLEINNCMDFVSKQLERNPFEDTVIVSDDAEFWSPLIESEVKRHVREWKISEIFGFKVEGFAEMSAIGACLKFVSDKVSDIDLFRKNRSSQEEISGTMTVWKIAVLICAIGLLWSFFVQVKSAFSSISLKKQDNAASESVADFAGLSAMEIETKSAEISQNQKTLSGLMDKVSYQRKLEALPALVPDAMWLQSFVLKYPFTAKSIRERKSLYMEGVASVSEGRQKELALGNQLTSAMETSPEMSDLCKGSASIDYDLSLGGVTGRQNAVQNMAGTKFMLRCERDAKK